MKSVLLIEDDPDHRGIATALLQHHGFRIVEAEDGATGLELASALRPDVVIMEYRLPDVDGMIVTQALRCDRELGSVPIVCWTEHGLRAEEARRFGCEHVVQKGDGPARLVALVQQLAGSE